MYAAAPSRVAYFATTFTYVHRTVRGRKQGVIRAHAHIDPGAILRAALANQNIAGENILTAELLDTQPLRVGIAAVTSATACFLMCHLLTLLFG
jgi:hypothetical protein